MKNVLIYTIALILLSIFMFTEFSTISGYALSGGMVKDYSIVVSARGEYVELPRRYGFRKFIMTSPVVYAVDVSGDFSQLTTMEFRKNSQVAKLTCDRDESNSCQKVISSIDGSIEGDWSIKITRNGIVQEFDGKIVKETSIFFPDLYLLSVM